MSIDYKFTIKRRCDGKKLASFYYNSIKNLSDIYFNNNELRLNLECIRNTKSKTYQFDDIERDIILLELLENQTKEKFRSKTELSVKAINLEVKDEIENEINSINDELFNIKCAIESLVGLQAIITCLTEDLIVNDGESTILAYSANAKDLTSTNGIFTADIEFDIEEQF